MKFETTPANSKAARWWLMIIIHSTGELYKKETKNLMLGKTERGPFELVSRLLIRYPRSIITDAQDLILAISPKHATGRPSDFVSAAVNALRDIQTDLGFALPLCVEAASVLIGLSVPVRRRLLRNLTNRAALDPLFTISTVTTKVITEMLITMETSDDWLGTDDENNDHDVKVKASSALYARPSTFKLFWLKEAAKVKANPRYNIFCGKVVGYNAVESNEIASAMGWVVDEPGAAAVLKSIKEKHANSRFKGKREGVSASAVTSINLSTVRQSSRSQVNSNPNTDDFVSAVHVMEVKYDSMSEEELGLFELDSFDVEEIDSTGSSYNPSSSLFSYPLPSSTPLICIRQWKAEDIDRRKQQMM